MKRIKVSILYGTYPNFDKDAFKYFILFVNKIQKTYEFFFPDVDDYPFEKGIIDFETSYEKVKTFVDDNSIIADHFVALITNSFSNNYFFNAVERISIITTDVWDKHFSPPSLFEYLLHCIYTCLMRSLNVQDNNALTEEQLKVKIKSHRDTRGCIADFTRQKFDDRIDITLGYICEQHTKEIIDYYGEEYLIELQSVIERKWIGSIEEKGTVAYNLKHVFKFDINKESGFNKSFWDKVKEKFYEIPGTLTGEILKILLTAILTYYLIKWGLFDKK